MVVASLLARLRALVRRIKKASIHNLTNYSNRFGHYPSGLNVDEMWILGRVSNAAPAIVYSFLSNDDSRRFPAHRNFQQQPELEKSMATASTSIQNLRRRKRPPSPYGSTGHSPLRVPRRFVVYGTTSSGRTGLMNTQPRPMRLPAWQAPLVCSIVTSGQTKSFASAIASAGILEISSTGYIALPQQSWSWISSRAKKN